MALTRRVQACAPPRRTAARRSRAGHAPAGRSWRRLLQDGRVYVAEPAACGHGTIVTVLRGGEDALRRVVVPSLVALAAFLLEDATGRRPPAARVQAFVAGVLDPEPTERLVVTSLDLCCWSIVHAVLDED